MHAVCNPARATVKVMAGMDVDAKWYDVVGYPKKCMVWACIGPGFKSRLYRINGSLTASGYIALLS